MRLSETYDRTANAPPPRDPPPTHPHTHLGHQPGVDGEDVRVKQLGVVGRHALRLLQTHSGTLRQDTRRRHLVIVADLATEKPRAATPIRADLATGNGLKDRS